MFKIESLLNLFQNEDTKKMLLYSYHFSQGKDKYLSDMIFEQLLSLKKMNPTIDIVLDETKDKSYFDPNEGIIFLNKISVGTFFHELTHLLSYNFSHFHVPNEYHLFKDNFLKSEKSKLIIELLNLCKMKKESYFAENDVQNSKDYNQVVKNPIDDIQQIFQSTQLDTIRETEDIIDSIFDGQSFTQGLINIKDNNSIATKSQRASGHGCEYFSNSNCQFEEILADFLAIKLTAPNNDLFILLKDIIGDEFVTFLDKRCSEICNVFSKYEEIEDINNNLKI